MKVNEKECKATCLRCKFDAFVGVEEVTEGDMREFLRLKNVNFTANCSYDNALQLCHLHEEDDDEFFATAITEAHHPSLPASFLHGLKLFHPDGPIKSFIGNPEEAGSITDVIRNLSVSAKDIFGLMCLLASLTDIDVRSKGDVSHKNVVPKNIIAMGSEGHVDSGE